MTLRRLFLLFLVAVITFAIGVVAAAVAGGFTPLVKFGRRGHRCEHASRHSIASPVVIEQIRTQDQTVTTAVDREGCRYVLSAGHGMRIEVLKGGRLSEAGGVVGTTESPAPAKR